MKTPEKKIEQSEATASDELQKEIDAELGIQDPEEGAVADLLENSGGKVGNERRKPNRNDRCCSGKSCKKVYNP